MKKALSIIMALAIVIGTFSFMASAYTPSSDITYGRYLLEPGSNLSTAPKFALGERVYGIVKGNEEAYYCFEPTTSDITFKIETSDSIDITITKNGGSKDYYEFKETSDTLTKSLTLEKGEIYEVKIKLSSSVIDRDIVTMDADATPAAEYCFYTSYIGMPTDVTADINKKEIELTVGDEFRLKLSNITVPDLNIFWRVYDDPETTIKESDVATVSGNGNEGTVKIKMNNGTFYKDAEIKVQAVWYYGAKDVAMVKTCVVKVIAANIHLDPYYETLYTGVGGFVDITAKTNLQNSGIIWTSADSTIATVTPQGRITGVAVGETKVTVQTQFDGTLIGREIKVIVQENHNSVIGVKLDKDSVSTRVGEEAKLGFSLTVVNPNLDPSNPRVTFESSNPDIATVDRNGKVTGVSQGEVTITIKTDDGSFKDTCKVAVKAAIPNWLMVVVAPLRIIINLIEIIFDITIDLPI